MSTATPKLSVVIVSYNTREMTLECLANLYKSLGPVSAELFVVDNASTDGSVAAVHQSFPHVTVIANETNIGFGAANNQAMSKASGEFILLLNSDAFPRPGAVGTLLDYLEQHLHTAAVGPRLLNSDGSLQKSCYRFPGPWRALCEHCLLTSLFPANSWLGDYRSWAHDRPRAVDFVIGACMLVRRTAIDHVGMFDESFFLYAEETDWCKRFNAAGWMIAFTPMAEVVHRAGASGKEQSPRVFTEFHRGQERFVRKHYGTLGLAWYRAMLILGSVIRVTLFSAAALVLPRRRTNMFGLCRKWIRILQWTLGARGAGLSEPHPMQTRPSEVVYG